MPETADDRLGEADPPADHPARDAFWQLPAAFVGGRLRPYRDVRAAFSPWRRAALVAWTEREEALVLPPATTTVH